MKYIIIVKKVIREIVGLITIILFIYTCTKVRSASGQPRSANNDTASTNAATGLNWPVQFAGYSPVAPDFAIPKIQDKRKALYTGTKK